MPETSCATKDQLGKHYEPNSLWAEVTDLPSHSNDIV